MKRAGTVVRTAQGLFVLRRDDEEYPAIGTPVVNEELDDVGRVVDVFGPVDRPYLAVTPEETTTASMVGNPLYYRD